jgi:hypothetical protein
MLSEVVDGLGPILAGRGLGQQPFYLACNQWVGRSLWGATYRMTFIEYAGATSDSGSSDASYAFGDSAVRGVQ